MAEGMYKGKTRWINTGILAIISLYFPILFSNLVSFLNFKWSQPHFFVNKCNTIHSIAQVQKLQGHTLFLSCSCNLPLLQKQMLNQNMSCILPLLAIFTTITLVQGTIISSLDWIKRTTPDCYLSLLPSQHLSIL